MIDLNEKIILKKSYFSLFAEYLTEDQYNEYVRAVINYSMYKVCEIKTPAVFVAFMFTKDDIDKEHKIIERNQSNAKYNAGRQKKLKVNNLIEAVINEKIITYSDLQEHFGVSKKTIQRRIAEIKDEEMKRNISTILK